MLNNDLAIAIAIVNFKGNVSLLLPVLRPQCQNLDLLQTFAAVQNLEKELTGRDLFQNERLQVTWAWDENPTLD